NQNRQIASRRAAMCSQDPFQAEVSAHRHDEKNQERHPADREQEDESDEEQSAPIKIGGEFSSPLQQNADDENERQRAGEQLPKAKLSKIHFAEDRKFFFSIGARVAEAGKTLYIF